MRFLLLLIAGTLMGQTVEVKSLYQPAPLSGNWKQHDGDDLRWADPQLDDSAWATVVMPEIAVMASVRKCWYRLRVQLPQDLPQDLPQEPLALLVGPFGNAYAYELFVDGRRIGTQGDLAAGMWGLRTATVAAFDIPSGQRSPVIALRVTKALSPYGFLPDALHRVSWIGTRDAIALQARSWRGEQLANVLPLLMVSAAIGISAAFFFILPLWRRDSPEYFWFGFFLLGTLGGLVPVAYPEGFGFERSLALVWFVVLTAGPAGVICFLYLMKTLFASRITWLAWLAGLVSLMQLALPLARFMAGSPMELKAQLALVAGLAVWMGLLYYEVGWRASTSPRGLRGLHITVICYLTLHLLQFVGLFVTFNEGLMVQAFFLKSCSLLVFAFAMSILLNQRAAALLSERQRMGQELAAAAEVQSLMLSPSSGGRSVFSIEPLYLPATEVGGDFYQILDSEDGSRLVLIGDVSGKGLRAAMVVSLVTGILRNRRSDRPGSILAEVNASLAGRMGGGFVTCCCARFDAGGAVTIANAGHPAPYADGRELEVEAGLPLGIVPDVVYHEFGVQGDRFTFVSDGVVEAENAQRELFGFDRTREICGRSAQQIADAAKAWGQNDDITVVTVRRRG